MRLRSLALLLPLLRAAAAVFVAGTLPVARAADGGGVVIESPRASVTIDDIRAEIARLPPDTRRQLEANPTRMGQLVDTVYLNRAFANDARRLGLDQDPVLARQMRLLVDRLLAQARIDRLEREAQAAFDADMQKYEVRARELYATQKDRFRVGERIHVSHVLVRSGAGGDAAAQARAEALRKRALGGEDFAALAREASEDPSAKANGGDLGMIEIGRFDPAFADAARALAKPGEISPVVKSSFGFHVLRFHAREPARVRTFEEAKPELMAEIRKEVVDKARADYRDAMFSPPPKVDNTEIERITREAGAEFDKLLKLPAPPRP